MTSPRALALWAGLLLCGAWLSVGGGSHLAESPAEGPRPLIERTVDDARAFRAATDRLRQTLEQITDAPSAAPAVPPRVSGAAMLRKYEVEALPVPPGAWPIAPWIEAP